VPGALIVGPGDRILPGVSYYTALVAAALAERGPVAMLLLRRLCPRSAYPGRARIGSTNGVLPLPEVPIFNGLDWFWGYSAMGAWRFWRRIRPRVMILQWWTATVLHSYVTLACLAKLVDARLVVEFHEVQDVGEARLPLVSRYTRTGMRLLMSRADAVVVHSEFDRRALRHTYPQLADLPIQLIPHEPYAHHVQLADAQASRGDGVPARHHPPRPGEPVRLLTFGVVRPYKGHAKLAAAVRLLTTSGLDNHVSVVGEVSQGYRETLKELAAILPADRLTIVDRYVADAEIPAFFAAAHVVDLPYRRCSGSRPLHIAMSCWHPVVATSVGGLVEATASYRGAVIVPPGDPGALAQGIRTALPLVNRAHADPHSWPWSVERCAAPLDRIDGGWSRDGRIPRDRTGKSSAVGKVA
jgi:glycosyltransferase involved in cell wall biosynthesis